MRILYIIKDQGSGGYVAWSHVSLIRERERAMKFTIEAVANKWCKDLITSVKNDSVRLIGFHKTFSVKKTNPGYFINPEVFNPVVLEIQQYS